jgi:hypothetical protein
MDPAITIPGDRRQNEIIRGRIQRYRLVILFCMSTRPEVALTGSASLASGDWILIEEGSS